jgi:hypothetical protein
VGTVDGGGIGEAAGIGDAAGIGVAVGICSGTSAMLTGYQQFMKQASSNLEQVQGPGLNR